MEKINKFQYGDLFSLSKFAKCDLTSCFDRFSAIQKCKIGKVRKPIFVIGSPRSGTTVLGKCFAKHPKIAGAEESLFLLLMWTIFSDLYLGDNKRKFSFLKDYTNIEEMLESIKCFSDRIITGLIEKQNKVYYIDHTPWYGMIFPFINLLYPDAIFIHLIRDGRRVVRSLSNSYKNGFGWAGKNIQERSELWANVVKHGIKIKAYLPQQYLEVKYEDFYEHPVGVLKSISKFVNLDFNQAMIEPLSTPHAEPSTKNIIIKIDKSLIDKETGHRVDKGWPRGWSLSQKKEFIYVAGHLMQKLYPEIKL